MATIRTSKKTKTRQVMLKYKVGAKSQDQLILAMNKIVYRFKLFKELMEELDVT